MKWKSVIIISIILSCVLSGWSAQEQTPLPEKYRRWLKEEVVYIITPAEKEVFPQLETNRERDFFIREFWAHRDPTPGSERNEFRDEHLRRIEYANQHFGREDASQGWRTDRGRIFITLGEPRRKTRFEGGVGESYPTEIWYFDGNPRLGEPPQFRLLFFQPSGVGSYKLYSHIADGPRSLTPLISMYDTSNPEHADQVAYNLLYSRVAPELAFASWSSFPSADGRRSLEHNHDRISSAKLTEEVRVFPQHKVEDDYAYEFLEHKASVKVSYSVNRIDCRYQVDVLRDPSGIFFVNYVLEPETLSLDVYQNRYFTNIRNTVRVTDDRDATVFQEERIFPLELTKEQLDQLGKRPFHVYDSFPLVTGDYTLHVLMENTVSKEFFSLERKIRVPKPEVLTMGPLILTHRVKKGSPYKDMNKPFLMGDLQIYPSPIKEFSNRQTLYVFFQIYGLDADWSKGGILHARIRGAEALAEDTRHPLKEFDGSQDFQLEFPLGSLVPGDYALEVELADEGGQEVLSAAKPFKVVLDSRPESWAVSQTSPAATDPLYAYVLGLQWLNLGEIEKARPLLAEAFASDPEALDYSLAYARTFLLAKEWNRVKEILMPFIEEGIGDFDLYAYLGRAHQEEKLWKEAISFYRQALSQDGNIVEVLNAIGECYRQSGDEQEARRVWTKSLELLPDQPLIREKLDSAAKHPV